MKLFAITEADLHSYVDGMLGPARRAEIEAYLALRPDEAQRLHSYTQHKHAVRALFLPVLDEAVPERLTGLPRPRPSRRGARWRPWLQPMAAGLLIGLAGGAAGWWLHGATGGGADLALLAGLPSQPGATLPRQAAIAHAVYSPELRHPVEIGAQQESQLVTWLSKRLGKPVRPPRLAVLGYELVGGRLLPGSSGPVAQFMYQNGAGQRLTLYVSTEQAAPQEAGFRFAQEGQVKVFYWIDTNFAYALSGGIDKGALASIASLVYQQLAPAP